MVTGYTIYKNYLTQISDALDAYTPCASENCSCYFDVIARDLKPFENGIPKKMIDQIQDRFLSTIIKFESIKTS